ncbi:MAG: hypothetical protein ACOCXA_06280 [Planctomycetota bacterium]
MFAEDLGEPAGVLEADVQGDAQQVVFAGVDQVAGLVDAHLRQQLREADLVLAQLLQIPRQLFVGHPAGRLPADRTGARRSGSAKAEKGHVRCSKSCPQGDRGQEWP